MNIYPFDEVALDAYGRMQQGHTVFQQFNCAHCGMKQTIESPNHFYTHGICEECGKDTDIKKDGCNFMVVMSTK
jgi:hypothetical protein